MRLLRVVTADGEYAYLAPRRVTCLVGEGRRTGVYTYDEKRLLVNEDVNALAGRILAALEEEADLTVEVGKDVEPVDGNITIRLSEYRSLLRNFYRGGVEDELKKIRERLAKLEGGAE